MKIKEKQQYIIITENACTNEKYLKNNEAELMELLDKNLTKAQMKAYEKLDEQAQLHVKDSLVKNVLLTAWDEKDDELAGLVKSKVKAALDEQK